ncbi:YggS family pyridoxal phosphate-dependent enzyme [uncultured Kocuria sp.]|uniref:YggS family pyridoxal phosphate-dependent enzyme n=1 Tax=uncultured Kocuria sp. TaxID=259305 RepID=UPI00262FF285|nr:YggS family pyridoxal phosphate-dependent enzyme [uncultured Kocuria sp.]
MSADRAAGSGGDDPRTLELARSLDRVRARIAAAAQRSGAAQEPVLVAVTKFFPAADVARLHRLGVRDVGENRDQEAAAKAREVAELVDGPLTWHFVGQLQSNKAKSVVRYASWVHSVDRASLVTALGKAVQRHRESVAAGDAAPGPCADQDLTCLVQVSLDAEERRGGARPEDVVGLAEQIAGTEGLRAGGIMAVAPLGAPPGPAFDRLREISQELRQSLPEATAVSAGMSQDLEEAVARGATHVRVGSDILGPRAPVG